jgi:hypothetical protein
MITMIKIDESVMNQLADEEQAVLMGFLGKKVSLTDLGDLVSASTVLALDPNSSKKENDMKNVEQKTLANTDCIQYGKYLIEPSTKSDHKLVGKTIDSPEVLSKGALAYLVMLLEQDLDDAEEPKVLTHDEQVILFWQDIGWDKKILNEKQMRWARKVAKHVVLRDNSRKLNDGSIKRVWQISWEKSYYKTNSVVLRKVMKSWAAAAEQKGLKYNMAPTGLLVYFN